MDFFDQKFTKEALQQGIVLSIDKPLGWTSFQVVNKIRWFLKNQTGLKKLKVGHAGTLDPLATGLLILCTGKKTKIIESLQNTEKEYTGTFFLGATTPSYDLETEIDKHFSTDHLNEQSIQATIPHFTGTIQQYPPLFSALKKDGKRLYEYARKGESTEIKARMIEIPLFEITRIELPEVDFRVRCSRGTYIRSLAHDFGKTLGTGAHLSSLKRIRSGSYNLIDAYSMKSVENINSNLNILKKN
ncbi:MAG: tRNA pseudouridine(55) synthase TruB [Flavobacteriaceae bacterium]